MFDEEMQRRRREAELAYDGVRQACDVFQIEKEQYIADYLALFLPLSITTGGTESWKIQ